MYKVHGLASHLRRLADHPNCAGCLRHFHTMQKLQAHLYYSRKCRELLQDRGLQCVQVPGTGSTEDLDRVERHDRQLPPLRGQGPLQAPVPHRVLLDFDEGVFDFIVEELTQHYDIEHLDGRIRQHASTLAITWTKFCITIQHFLDTFTEEDASAFNIDMQQVESCRGSVSPPPGHSSLRTCRARRAFPV